MQSVLQNFEKPNHKRVIGELPLETWTDIFHFLPRSQLAKLVPHICDRQFVSFLQFFLHKCGDITLYQLGIKSSTRGNNGNNGSSSTAIVRVRPTPNQSWELPLIEVPPIPPNVKTFTRSYLSYFDESVRTFLRESNRDNLLTNIAVDLDCIHHYNSDALVPLMTTLVPSITGSIKTISIYSSLILDLVRTECSEFAKPMMVAARVLHTSYDYQDEWFCRWLHIPREDGKPRVLYFDIYNENHSPSLSSFVEYIKKDFFGAKQPVSFFIKLFCFADAAYVREEILDNIETQERLVLKNINYSYIVMVSRYPMGATEEWIEEMHESAYY